MKILVAVGSKYGATREVAKHIADQIAERGFDVDFADACDVQGLHFYDAVVLGSAVYGGLWRRDASNLLRQNTEELQKKDVWLFSVGMETVIKPGQPLDESDGFKELVGAHDHARFPGALDYDRLNVGEKALITALNPPRGDFRDFEAVRDWTSEIVQRLEELSFA
ncbi:flavodoxin domain-containing protein [Demequina capsici]|uniref:Flavodoxin domain-containing protein n=1 Tax=Demequina capsici TaxID=3075620 RepID=A0AA96F8Q2_9MICO|nr:MULTISPECIES: flavodoxin domain-containing protein [unclassified Demequina]WNM25818.1 flavodoxin domain-containing protein [Demequina sp. OYTSA14]WNM28713.1 flavodoxin domain-containing protein [Demequina sp. PMTSA13]